MAAGLIVAAGVAVALARTVAAHPTECVRGRSLDAGCFVGRDGVFIIGLDKKDASRR